MLFLVSGLFASRGWRPGDTQITHLTHANPDKNSSGFFVSGLFASRGRRPGDKQITDLTHANPEKNFFCFLFFCFITTPTTKAEPRADLCFRPYLLAAGGGRATHRSHILRTQTPTKTQFFSFFFLSCRVLCGFILVVCLCV